MTFSTLFKRILFLFLQENMRLMKALTERKYETCDYFVYVDLLLMIIAVFCDHSAIIERTGSELQRYRINLQMVQAQNLQLSQTNTRILAVYLIFD